MTGEMTRRERELKIATADLCEELHGYEAAASYIDRAKSTVHRWASAQSPDDFIPLRFIPELERRSRRPHITIALAKMAGGVFVRLPEIFDDRDMLPLQVCQLAHSLGDVSQAVVESLADGEVCRRDSKRIEAELDELIALAAQAREGLRLMRAEEEEKG